MNLPATFYRSAQFAVNGNIVSSVDSHLPQVDTLRKRMTKSAEYLENVGAQAEFWNSSQIMRNGEYILHDSKGADVIYQPALSIFGYQKALPPGQYSLEMVPNSATDLKIFSVEAKAGANIAPSTYKITVDEVAFYCCIVDGPRPDPNTRFILDLTEMRVNVRPLSSSTSMQQFSIDVAPKLKALTLAFQSNTLSNLQPVTKFTIAGNLERKLKSYYINYGGQQHPYSPVDIDGSDRHYSVQQYFQNTLQSAVVPQSWDYERHRGLYYHQRLYRSGTSQATTARVNCQFTVDASAGNLLCFETYQRVFQVTMSGGRVVAVQEM
jgi:hypothetical protein